VARRATYVHAFAALLAILSWVAPTPAALAAPISGEITADTTWTAANSPYVVSSLTIAAGATLTLEPGVVVKFTYPGSTLTVNGALVAGGASEAKVYFTSYKDDTVGGDTNGDGTASQPASGDWSGILVNTGGQANLQHTELRYGGYNSTSYIRALLKVQGGTATLSDCVVNRSALYGIWLEAGGSLSLTRTTVSNCSSLGLYSQECDLTLDGCTVSSSLKAVFTSKLGRVVMNGTWVSSTAEVQLLSGAGLELQGSGNSIPRGLRVYGSIGYDTTLPGSSLGDVPYVLSQNLTVDAGKTLTFGAGSVIKAMYPAVTLTVNGALVAGGTSEAKVYFTSYKDDTVGGDTNGDGTASQPASGDWSGILVNTGGQANLQHTELRYGGYNSTSYIRALLKVQGGTASLSGCAVSRSAVRGVHVEGGALYMTRTRVSQNQTGVYVSGLRPEVCIEECSIVSNSGWGVYNDTNPTIVDAKRNWWGDVLGPWPYGSGDKAYDVTCNLDVTEWLDYDPTVEPPVSEPPADAYRIYAGVKRGQLGSVTETDHYKLWVWSWCAFEATLEPPASADYDLELLSVTGDVIGSSRNRGAGVPESVSFTPVSDGWFYFRVKAAGSCAPGEEYSLRVRFLEPAKVALRYAKAYVELGVSWYARPWDTEAEGATRAPLPNDDSYAVFISGGCPWGNGLKDLPSAAEEKLKRNCELVTAQRFLDYWYPESVRGQVYSPNLYYQTRDPETGALDAVRFEGETQTHRYGWVGVDCVGLVQRCLWLAGYKVTDEAWTEYGRIGALDEDGYIVPNTWGGEKGVDYFAQDLPFIVDVTDWVNCGDPYDFQYVSGNGPVRPGDIVLYEKPGEGRVHIALVWQAGTNQASTRVYHSVWSCMYRDAITGTRLHRRAVDTPSQVLSKEGSRLKIRRLVEGR